MVSTAGSGLTSLVVFVIYSGPAQPQSWSDVNATVNTVAQLKLTLSPRCCSRPRPHSSGENAPQSPLIVCLKGHHYVLEKKMLPSCAIILETSCELQFIYLSTTLTTIGGALKGFSKYGLTGLNLCCNVKLLPQLYYAVVIKCGLAPARTSKPTFFYFCYFHMILYYSK